MGYVRDGLMLLSGRSFNVQAWWRVGAAEFSVRAWTVRGAIKKGQRIAKLLKPKADLLGVTVR
jgi:hypothetical protein